MKKNIYHYLLILLALVFLVPGANTNAAEIILPSAPEFLFEGTEILFEVKGINSSRFRWEFGDGTTKIGSRRITHVFKGRGTFNVKVFYLEGKLEKFITKRIKIVKDDREIVIFGQAFYPGVPVEMEARNFIDRSVRWDFGDGKDQKLGRSVTHIYNRSGTFTVKAVDFGGRGTKKIIKPITINKDNRSIVVPKEIIAGEAAELQLKNAPGGDYTWEFSDGQRASGLSIKTAVFKRAGMVTVRVTDRSGRYPPLTQKITVKPDNRQLKSSLDFALPEEAVWFEAVQFRGPTVTWNFGDGTGKTNGSKRETHVYQQTGRFKVTARDFNGTSQKTFSTNLIVSELSPNFRLNLLEIAFTNGKYYQVAPLRQSPPAYYVRMKALGRGILRGKWILDGQPIGLFSLLLHENKIGELKGNAVPALPLKDAGIHDFTIAFTNYTFTRGIPNIRYFVTEADALQIQSPGPGARVPWQESLQLQWRWPDPYTSKKWNPTYQVIVSEIPIQFLTDEQISSKWKDAGKQNQYRLDLSSLRDKNKKGTWIYWQVRALTPGGDLLTVSEISSFKLVK
ncbi:MAG: hypothetical protein JSV88_06600 [Candidatus Aminicenantes bacterium]|nr:MAG: hypothetical protein JSV88_06600 [Candidatus Aminicenantes bacterium]